MPATFSAKYPSRCHNCSTRISVGESIKWHPSVKGKVIHPTCPISENPIVEPVEAVSEDASQPRYNAISGVLPAQTYQTPTLDVQAVLALAQTQGSPIARDVLGPNGLIAQKLPNYEYRESQLAVADLINAALIENESAVIEAGTGTGKSLAYLVPGLLSRKPFVVATADNNLLNQLWTKDIPFLQTVMPFTFKAARLKGRSNYLCLMKADETAKRLEKREQVFKRSDNVVLFSEITSPDSKAAVDGDLEAVGITLDSELRESITVDSDGCLGDKCEFISSCFVERAKAEAEKAQVVITNQSLLLIDLELRYQTEDHASVLPDSNFYVIDEAHNLEDRAVDAFAIEISFNRWNRLEKRVSRIAVGDEVEAATDAVNDALVTLFDDFFRRIKANKDAKTFKVYDERKHADLINGALANLVSVLKRVIANVDSDRDRTKIEKLIKQVNKLANDFAIMLSDEVGMSFVRYAEMQDNGNVKFIAKLVEVAGYLNSRLFNGSASVFCLSATIATNEGFSYWRNRVGMTRACELIVSSPFDYKRNAVLYLPVEGKAFDSSLYRKSASDTDLYFDRLANRMGQLVTASKGGAFLLFTSNTAMRAVHDRIGDKLRTKYRVMMQGEAPRGELIRLLKEDGNAVLFGVKSFWEGVDVQGSALRLVVIDKLPFTPPDDPVYQARCDALVKRTGNDWAWFNQLAIPNAIIALKQGVGRLVRTGDDYGVMAILDGRIVTKGYGVTIIRSLPPATQIRSVEAITKFYEGRN